MSGGSFFYVKNHGFVKINSNFALEFLVAPFFVSENKVLKKGIR
jgi:hypothetical protein